MAVSKSSAGIEMNVIYGGGPLYRLVETAWRAVQSMVSEVFYGRSTRIAIEMRGREPGRDEYIHHMTTGGMGSIAVGGIDNEGLRPSHS